MQPVMHCIALKDAVNGWTVLHFCAAPLFSVNIIALHLHCHIAVAHSFPYTEQNHRPTTPNALEFPSGRLPTDHTDVSQAMLKQKINFPSPSVHTAQEIKSMQGLNMTYINKEYSEFHHSCLFACCTPCSSVTTHVCRF